MGGRPGRERREVSRTLYMSSTVNVTLYQDSTEPKPGPSAPFRLHLYPVHSLRQNRGRAVVSTTCAHISYSQPSVSNATTTYTVLHSYRLYRVRTNKL